MKYIIIGTNRPHSRSRQVGNLVQKIYLELGEQVGMIDLAELPLQILTGHQYEQTLPGEIGKAIHAVNDSSGLIFIVPEYNGSYPGILKYFIDHWKYPDAFEHRPMCFVGLGGMFGGLRAVEHLQGAVGHRNAFIFPQRVFLTKIWNTLKDGQLQDPAAVSLLLKQAQDFRKFTDAIDQAELDARTLNSRRQTKS